MTRQGNAFSCRCHVQVRLWRWIGCLLRIQHIRVVLRQIMINEDNCRCRIHVPMDQYPVRYDNRIRFLLYRMLFSMLVLGQASAIVSFLCLFEGRIGDHRLVVLN